MFIGKPGQLRSSRSSDTQKASDVGVELRDSSEIQTATPNSFPIPKPVETGNTPFPENGSDQDSKGEQDNFARTIPNTSAVPWPHVEQWRRNVALAGIFLGLFFSTLDSSIVSTALVSMIEDFGDFALSPWIVLAYLLTYMSFAMAFARFSDVYGRKSILLVSWALFMLSSLACAVSKTMIQLIVFRAFQGLGGAGLYSLGMVMIPEVLKSTQLGLGSALVGLTIGGSGVLGPVLGGVISHLSTWRWVFYINLPFGAVITASIFFLWPATEGSSLNSWNAFLSIDFTGIGLLLGASICLIYGLQAATTGGHSWSYPPVIATLVLSGLFWIGFMAWETLLSTRSWSSIQPIFPVHIVKRRIMAAVFASIFFTGFPFITILIILPERFQLVNHATSLMAGVYLLPLAGSVGIGSFIGGAISSKKNYTSPTVIFASCLQLLGLGLLTTIGDSVDVAAKQYGFQFILGFGIGMSLAAGTIMVTINSKRGELGASQGATSQMRPLGGVIGLSIATALFNARSDAGLKEFLSADQLAALRRSPLAALEFAPDAMMQVRTVYAHAFTAQIQVLMYVAAIGLVAACFTWERTPIELSETNVHRGLDKDGNVLAHEQPARQAEIKSV